MAGGSSPVTLAGTLVTHNAEVLAGITLSQLDPAGRRGRVRQLDDGHGPAPRLGERGLARVRPHQRRRRADRPLLPAAQLGGGCVGRLQSGRCPEWPREDPDRPYAGVGRCQPHLRSGDDRVGHDLRLRAARHGRRVRRHDQAVRPRHPRGRRVARARRDRRDRSVRRLPQPRPHDGAHAGDLAACGHRPARARGLAADGRDHRAGSRSGQGAHDPGDARPDPLPDGVAAELAEIIRGAERELGVS